MMNSYEHEMTPLCYVLQNRFIATKQNPWLGYPVPQLEQATS
jgi:hypothetical protein